MHGQQNIKITWNFISCVKEITASLLQISDSWSCLKRIAVELRGENLETGETVKKFSRHLQLLSRRHDICCRFELLPFCASSHLCSTCCQCSVFVLHIRLMAVGLQAILLHHCDYPTSLFNDGVACCSVSCNFLWLNLLKIN